MSKNWLDTVFKFLGILKKHWNDKQPRQKKDGPIFFETEFST